MYDNSSIKSGKGEIYVYYCKILKPYMKGQILLEGIHIYTINMYTVNHRVTTEITKQLQWLINKR